MHHLLEFGKANGAIAVEVHFLHKLTESLIAEVEAALAEHASDLGEIDLAVAVLVKEGVGSSQPFLAQDFVFVHGSAAPFVVVDRTIVVEVYLLENAIGLEAGLIVAPSDPLQAHEDLLIAKLAVTVLID